MSRKLNSVGRGLCVAALTSLVAVVALTQPGWNELSLDQLRGVNTGIACVALLGIALVVAFPKGGRS